MDRRDPPECVDLTAIKQRRMMNVSLKRNALRGAFIMVVMTTGAIIFVLGLWKVVSWVILWFTESVKGGVR